MPLLRLILRNFQRHERLSLPLDPKVTTIIGDSDSGKSAVLRALRWVCRNKPNGTDFVRHGQKLCRVSVLAGDRRIHRSRGAGNSYHLDGEELKAFGADVPSPVRKVLKTTDLNFQLQHDAPFWFSLSPGDLAQRLNALVNLSKIDSIQKKIRTGRSKAEAEVTIRRENYRKHKADLIGLAPVTTFLEELAVLEEQEARLVKLQTKTRSLSTWVEDAEPVYAAAKSEVPDVSDLRTRVDNMSTLLTRTKRLKDLIAQCESSEIEARARASAFEQAEQAFHEQTKGQVCPICHQIIPS